MSAVEPESSGTIAARGGPDEADVPARVFRALVDRLQSRAADVVRFTAAGRPYEEWFVWEGAAACQEAGWGVEPHPAYAAAGVVGSRESADLLISDPARGTRVLVEISLVHDWTSNKWIDQLDGDTAKLGRPLAPGIVPLQIVVLVSVDSTLEVNPLRQQWLGMSTVWNRPTALASSFAVGSTGQITVRAWCPQDPRESAP